MVYWTVFILLSALVMLSLFIGAVTMAMRKHEEMKAEESTERMIKAYFKREAQREKRERAKEALKKNT